MTAYRRSCLADARKKLCGRIIKTSDGTRKPCLRDFGHAEGCNPFSPDLPKESEHQLEQDLGSGSPYW